MVLHAAGNFIQCICMYIPIDLCACVMYVQHKSTTVGMSTAPVIFFKDPKPAMTACCVQGEVKQGRDILYGAQRSAYAVEPWETVNYADCHDGQTLFDQVLLQMLFCRCSVLNHQDHMLGSQMHGRVQSAGV